MDTNSNKERLLLDEQAVTDFSIKTANKFIAEFVKAVPSAFNDELEGWVYERAINCEDKVREHYIDLICDKFIKNPSDYDYRGLRDKLFEENQDTISKAVSEDMTQRFMFSYLWYNVLPDESFRQGYVNGIIRCIKDNWDSFKDSPLIQSSLINENLKLKQEVDSLRDRVGKLTTALESYD
jgi:hypothetical protein